MTPQLSAPGLLLCTSLLLAIRVISRQRGIPVAFGAKRTSIDFMSTARLAYVFGMVLAVAAIILAITTPNLAAPRSPIYDPQLLLLY